MLTRRFVITAATAAALTPRAALAAEFVYKDWRFNTDRVGGDLSKATIASLQAQVDIVEAVRIRPEIKAFFRGVPIRLDHATRGGPGAYSFDDRIMTLSLEPQPTDNPVLLHELIHAYQNERLAGGRRDPKLLAFFQAAKAAGDFPDGAYMYKNPAEFFAMCASVVIWGRAARPPSTRANVHAKMPALYDWIVETFGLELT